MCWQHPAFKTSPSQLLGGTKCKSEMLSWECCCVPVSLIHWHIRHRQWSVPHHLLSLAVSTSPACQTMPCTTQFSTSLCTLTSVHIISPNRLYQAGLSMFYVNNILFTYDSNDQLITIILQVSQGFALSVLYRLRTSKNWVILDIL